MKGTDEANRVAGKEQGIDTLLDEFFDAVILSEIPILIVSNTDEGFAFEDSIRRQKIPVGGIADVVAVLFQPIGQRELPR